MAILKVYNGSSWDEPVAKVYNGSAWVGNKKFYNGSSWVDLFMSGVTPSVSDVYVKETVSSGACNAGIVFHDYRLGSGGDDGRVLTRRNKAVYTDMGNDNAPSPVDHTGEWTTETIVESEWEVANTVLISGNWYLPHATVGVYSTLDTQDMQWRARRVGAKSYSPGTTTVVGTFRIREVADTANFVDFQLTCIAVQT